MGSEAYEALRHVSKRSGDGISDRGENKTASAENILIEDLKFLEILNREKDNPL